VASTAPSTLDLIAVALYAVILAACLFAALTAGRFRQPLAHGRTWVLVGLVFALLALMRLVSAEELLRDLLRAELRSEGAYLERRTWQAPTVVVLSVAFTGLFLWGLRQRFAAPHGRRNMALFAAYVAVGIMAFLMALRIVSLHQIDLLLYGPLKFNWVIDIGASLTVLASAVLYVRAVSRRP
jgi:hypothetical protein